MLSCDGLTKHGCSFQSIRWIQMHLFDKSCSYYIDMEARHILHQRKRLLSTQGPTPLSQNHHSYLTSTNFRSFSKNSFIPLNRIVSLSSLLNFIHRELTKYLSNSSSISDQVTVPNRFIRIGRDGSISYSQVRSHLSISTLFPHFSSSSSSHLVDTFTW